MGNSDPLSSANRAEEAPASSSGAGGSAGTGGHRVLNGTTFKSPTIGETAMNKLAEDKIDLVFKAKRANVYTEGVVLDTDDPFVAKRYESYPKTSIQAELIRTAIDRNFVFSALGSSEKEVIVDAMELLDVKEDEDLIVQGEEGDAFFVIYSGTFDVIIGERVVGVLTEGASLGDLSLLFSTPRQATIRAAVDGKVFSLYRDTFRGSLAHLTFARTHLVVEALSKVQLLCALNRGQLQKIADSVEIKRYSKGDRIIQRGSPGNSFYMIKEGYVRVTDIGTVDLQNIDTDELEAMGVGNNKVGYIQQGLSPTKTGALPPVNVNYGSGVYEKKTEGSGGDGLFSITERRPSVPVVEPFSPPPQMASGASSSSRASSTRGNSRSSTPNHAERRAMLDSTENGRKSPVVIMSDDRRRSTDSRARREPSRSSPGLASEQASLPPIHTSPLYQPSPPPIHTSPLSVIENSAHSRRDLSWLADEEDGSSPYSSPSLTDETSSCIQREFSDSDPQLGPGQHFGELALLTGDPRSADIYAETNCVLMCLDRSSFNALLGPLRDLVDFNMKMRAIDSIELFNDFTKDEKTSICGIFELRKIPPDHHVVSKGKIGKTLFILRKGFARICTEDEEKEEEDEEVKKTNEEKRIEENDKKEVGKNIKKEGEKKSDEEKEEEKKNNEEEKKSNEEEKKNKEDKVGEKAAGGGNSRSVLTADMTMPGMVSQGQHGGGGYLDAGAYFGDRSLEIDEERKASIIAVSACEFYTLNRFTLARLVGSWGKLGSTVEMQWNIRFAELEHIAVLGTGTFGRVTLVRDTSSSCSTENAVFAMKSMLRSELVMFKQQKNVFNEKRVLMMCNHTFIQRLVQTFRDSKWLHFLFEFVQGGELFSIIHTSASDGMPEQQAKFYACGLILAVEYLHSKDVIHRDIKPENVLIDQLGYPKLIDFGFAKLLSGGKSYTLCGTPEYLSPEMVLSRGHAKGVDYWELGILLYEMIAGTTPFCDHHNMDQVAILQSIVTQRPEFNYKFRSDVQDIIEKLLTHDPHIRLGNLKGGVSDIKSHSWFNGVDWGVYAMRQIRAPWVPPVDSPTDHRHYDPYGVNDHIDDTYNDGRGISSSSRIDDDNNSNSNRGKNWDADF